MDKCEICGQRVRMNSGKEGTGSYEGIEREELLKEMPTLWEIIKAMDSREDYTRSGIRNLCLRKILNDNNIKKLAKAISDRIRML